MLLKYSIAALFAIVGLAVVAANTANNVFEVNRTQFALDITAVVICLSAISILLSMFLARITRESVTYGLVAVLVVAGCAATSMRLTADRIGGVDTDAAQVGRDANGSIDRLDRRISGLGDKLNMQRAIAARECRGYREGVSKPAKWPKCLTARGLLAAFDGDLAKATAERATLGEKRVVERHSERFLGWVFGPRAGAAAAMIQPVMIAALLEIGGAFLLSIAGLLGCANSKATAGPQIVEAQAVEIMPADPVVKLLRQHNRALSNAEIATALGISAPAASKRVKRLAADGVVQSEKTGREVSIRLA